jgi:hypothetical protein
MLKDQMMFSKNIKSIPRICLGNVTVQLKSNFNRIKHRKTESQRTWKTAKLIEPIQLLFVTIHAHKNWLLQN